MRRLVVAASLLALLARVAAATVASDLCPDTADPCAVTTSKTVTPGSVLDFGTRTLVVRTGAKIIVSGGPLTIKAGAVQVETNGSILGTGGANGANIAITADAGIRIDGGGSSNGRIDVSASLNAGQIDLVAGTDVVVAGFLDANGTTTDGSGGVVNVTAGGSVTVSGAVRVRGGSASIGGLLTVVARDATVSGLIDASSADGGIVDFELTGGFLHAAGASLVLRGGGGFGDGGELDVITHDDIQIAGQIVAQAGGTYASGGGSGANILFISEAGSITLSAPLNFSGAAPDGEGGELDLDAGVDITQSGGTLFGQGGGIDTCGGSVFASAGRRLTLAGTVRLDGGSCGGGLLIADAGELAALNATLDGTGSGGGAAIVVDAGRISVGGKINVSGTVTGAAGGQIDLTACRIDDLAGSTLQADGVGGRNRLQASGQLTIGGKLSAVPAGTNVFGYGDPGMPPVILGGASITPAATQSVNPSLPVCVETGAVCGNGVLEAGEQCDDGNLEPCDGCSAACRTEGCGNRVIECDEECDNGIANGTPGNGCSATCTAIESPGILLKPGKRVGSTGCFLEWAIRNPAGAVRNGIPSPTQVCIDGNPACDGDGAANGVCVFRTAACLAPIDARLPLCQPTAIAAAQLRKPNAIAPRDATDGANSAAIQAALTGLGITVTFRDTTLVPGTANASRGVCSPEFDLLVPHAPGSTGTRLVKTGASDASGRVMRSNRLALVCLPNPATCGNGVTEVGESCDDGNITSCDGCSDHCRVEACGNNVVDCGEDCDDGIANGQPGSRCTAACTEAPPPLRIPGGGRPTECAAEWSLATASPTLLKSGLPHIKQTCVDNDPACDFDPTPGTCRLHVWQCAGGADDRLGCAAAPVATVELIRPRATQTGFSAAARTAFLAALGGLTLPTTDGERCSTRAALDVPAGKSRLVLRTVARTGDGRADRDTLKLSCSP